MASATRWTRTSSFEPLTRMQLIGVDGCGAGWVLAIGDTGLGSLDFAIERDFTGLARLAGAGQALIAIDIPIGLAETGPRACDLAARLLLGRPRSSSVFAAPCRPTLSATTYLDACAINLAACGKAVTKQLYNIMPKIRQVDALMTPGLQTWVREVHPEVVFAALAGVGQGLGSRKRTPAGEDERLELLARWLPRVAVGKVRSCLGPQHAARDDIVDALACLVSAYRICRGQHLVLPSGRVPLDSRGLRMEILA